MRYGSVCSGIEAASVAWHSLGWRAAWLSEIEPFPCSVLAYHYPEVPNLGDMTKFQEWPDDAIDLLVGGTPCQSFSIAGLRAGLADPRGNLMLTYLAIAAKYRPRWLVWENVPGVLSSNGGRDFGTLLRGLGELGYGFAYRVLDAQFCRASGYHRAVPQRRRRVFVVGYFGDWRRAAAVLFDGQSLRGDPPPSREAGTGVADFAVSRALTSSHTATGRLDPNEATFLPVAFNITPSNSNKDYNARQASYAQALTAQGGAPSARGGDLVATAIAIQERAVSENIDAGPQGRGFQEGVAYTLEARNKTQSVAHAWAVRRLTPTECERLQGFPDGYTAIPHRNKPAADGPRYKALGNSMAVNVMRVIGERLATVDATLESKREAA